MFRSGGLSSDVRSGLSESVKRPVRPDEGICLLEERGLRFSFILEVAAMILVWVLGAARAKPPAEKSMLVHLFWLRALPERKLSAFDWLGTRDMTADRHTKG